MHSLKNYIQTLSKNSIEYYSANLPQEVYEAYVKERDLTVSRFKNSLENCKIPTYSPLSELQVTELVDSVLTPKQQNYKDIIFDEKLCAHLYDDTNQEYYTIADGGTIPCAMVSVLNYFKFPDSESDILSIGKKIVKYGYRKNGKGVLHIYFDKFVPNYYNLKVSRPLSFSYMLEALIRGSVLRLNDSSRKKGIIVLALVSSEILGIKSNSNTAVVIFGIDEGKYLYTSSNSDSFSYIDIPFMNKHINAAWIISKE